jgi:hypothetical protein
MSAEMTVRIDGQAVGSSTVATKPTMVPTLPDSSEYLGGSAVSTGTIITIPQGRSWYGWVSLAANLSTATTNTAPNIHTTGTGAKPDPAGKIVEIRLQTTAGVTETHGEMVTPYFAIYTGSTAATITLETAAANDVTGVAYGWLI